MKSIKIYCKLILIILLSSFVFFVSCKKTKETIPPEIPPEISRPLIDSICVTSYRLGPGLDSHYKMIYKYFYQDNKVIKVELKIKILPEPSEFVLSNYFTFQYNDQSVVYCKYNSLNNIVEQHIYLLDIHGYASEFSHDQFGFIINSDFEVQSYNIFCINPTFAVFQNMVYNSNDANFNQFNIFNRNNPVFYYADFIGRASQKLIASAQGENYNYTFDENSRVTKMTYWGHSGESGDEFEFYYK